jgi:hypothetical protein
MAISESKASKIAAAHLAGMSIRQICKALGTCHNSVVSVIRNRPELLERAREVTAANWKTIAAISTSQLLERLPDLKDAQLAIVSGISTDKALLLSGEPTQRVEVNVGPAADQWEAFVANLRRQEAIDVQFEPVELAAPPQKNEYAQLW